MSHKGNETVDPWATAAAAVPVAPVATAVNSLLARVAATLTTDLSEASTRTWRRTLLLTVAVAIAAIGTAWPRLLPAPSAPDNDGHSLASLELAANWIFCGRYAMRDGTDGRVGYWLSAPHSAETPVREIAVRLAGSTATYCARVTSPWRNNENSLMLVMGAVLAAWPDASLGDIGRAMRWLRVIPLVLMALVMLRCGASTWVTFGALYGALVTTAAVEGIRFYAVYPFLPAIVVGFPATLVLVLELRGHTTIPRAAVSGLTIGWLAAAAVNMRSSYMPILLGGAGVLVILGAREGWRADGSRHVLARSAVLVAALGAGFLAFQWIFIRPIDRLPVTENMSYHAIAHPLVLGLARPPNRFARRLGIEWNDDVGLTLARRIDPAVSGLSARYESALFTYYRQLWRENPREMLALYWRKLRSSGKDLPGNGPPGVFFSLTLLPASVAGHGALKTVIFALLAVGPLFLGGRWSAGGRALMSLCGVSGLLLMCETALILTTFSVLYGEPLMLIAIIGGLAGWQLAVNLAVRSARGGNGAPGRDGPSA